MYVLALNERDHYTMTDIATRSVRTVAREVIVPTIVCYLKGGDTSIALTWDQKHRSDARELMKTHGCIFSPREIAAMATAAEANVDADALLTWISRKREVREGAMWLLDEREALITRPNAKKAPGKAIMNEPGFAWPRHESVGITIGGLLAYFALVPYLCVFPDEPMRVLPDSESPRR
jgi:hypothetical protein